MDPLDQTSTGKVTAPHQHDPVVEHEHPLRRSGDLHGGHPLRRCDDPNMAGPDKPGPHSSTSEMEQEAERQHKFNRTMGRALDRLGSHEDNWSHRAQNMRCQTCMWWVPKTSAPETSAPEYEIVADVVSEEPADLARGPEVKIGRCRHASPTMKGWPATFPTDWCGDHKLDEAKV